MSVLHHALGLGHRSVQPGGLPGRLVHPQAGPPQRNSRRHEQRILRRRSLEQRDRPLDVVGLFGRSQCSLGLEVGLECLGHGGRQRREMRRGLLRDVDVEHACDAQDETILERGQVAGAVLDHGRADGPARARFDRGHGQVKAVAATVQCAAECYRRVELPMGIPDRLHTALESLGARHDPEPLRGVVLDDIEPTGHHFGQPSGELLQLGVLPVGRERHHGDVLGDRQRGLRQPASGDLEPGSSQEDRRHGHGRPERNTQRDGAPGPLGRWHGRMALRQGLEGEGDVTGGLEAVVGALLQAALDDAFECGWDGSIGLAQRRRIPGEDRRRDVYRGLTREGAPPREHLIEHAAEREDVRPVVHGLAAQLLGRHVAAGPEHHAGARGRVLGRRVRRHVRRAAAPR